MISEKFREEIYTFAEKREKNTGATLSEGLKSDSGIGMSKS